MIPVHNKLLNVEPQELRFTYELNKKSSCTIRLSNDSQNHIAFKVMTTYPKKYAVRPNIGLLSPRSTIDVEVTMAGPTEALSDIHCKDKFLIKSVITSPFTTAENARRLFKEPGRSFEDFKLRVVYIFPSQASNDQRSSAAGSLQRVSTFQEATLNGSEVEGKNGVQYGDLIMKVVLCVIVIWFLIMKILPRIWSLTFFITMLLVKMINKVISDSVEEWILKILCGIFLHYVPSILRGIGTYLKLVQ